MRELIEGVTKIRWKGHETQFTPNSLCKHKTGTYIGEGCGICRWVSPLGNKFLYGDTKKILNDELGTDHEFVDEDESQEVQSLTKLKEDIKVMHETTWSGEHYDKYYHLTPEDIAEGKIRLDAYTVAKVWKIGSKDDSGALFHTFKLFPRWGEKNTVEREIVALYNQAKALARVYNVKLGGK